MTVYVVSLFLPYTIDFEAAAISRGRRRFSRNHPGKVEGRLAESRREQSRDLNLTLTPGATTDHEKIFKPFYAAGEAPAADLPKGPTPSEPRSVSWGASHKFNQPKLKAVTHPDSSILSRPGGDETSVKLGDGAISDSIDSDDDNGSPQVLLSDVDWVVKAAEQGNGGLRNAINAAADAGILPNKTWVGTLGMPTDSLKEHTRSNIDRTLREEYDSLPVFVSDSEFDGHYSHFCRTVLWPAFHYQVQESPRHKEYDDHTWRQYVKVNEAFADTIASNWKPGDSIWVHDYHLLLLPALLRKRLPEAEIGFFMHAAFPSSEVFRCLAIRDALLEGLLGADLVAFQTEEYCHHFLQTCSRLLSLEVTSDGVQFRDRFIHVKNTPIGIDPVSLYETRKTAEVQDWVSKIRDRYEGKHLIVARDRLDAPGGIKQKLLSYELFLKKYPKWRENVVLVQVASSMSELPELEAQISKIAMRINSVYSTLTHQPLVLLKQDISYSQFLALMTVAEIFMVTSLRDGMNLTGHDYLHCQDGKLSPQRYGSLILSEFTGSAHIFSGHELLVNPWDYKQCAEAINRALEMPAEQKQKNWQFLIDKMAPHTAQAWCKSLDQALSDAHQTQLSHEPSFVSPFSMDALKESYKRAHRRLFIVEDDISLSLSPKTPPKRTIAALNGLLKDPNNIVYLTSSKAPEDLESRIEGLSKDVGLIAENGCFLRTAGSETWEELVDASKTKEWRDGIRKVIHYFQERTDGSSIEEGRCSITFWYKDAYDPELAARQASELADQINGSRGSEPIRAVLTKGAVTVEPTEVTKATAAQSILERLSEKPDFILVAGGARGDEPLFRWANALGQKGTVPDVATVTVGSHVTEAKAMLLNEVSVTDILATLQAPPDVNGSS
ncbi:CAZyme family GT20 [Paecilomyces variotii]|nr:CAZyme family GT20 [Paecilomyces variotii]